MVHPIFPSYTKWDNFDYENAHKEMKESQGISPVKKKSKFIAIKQILILTNETIVMLSKNLKENRNKYIEEKFGTKIRRRRRKKREKYSTYATFVLNQNDSWTYVVDDSILHVEEINKKIGDDLFEGFKCEENKLKVQIQQKKREAELLGKIMTHHDTAQKNIEIKKYDVSLYEYKKGIDTLLTYEESVNDNDIQNDDELSNDSKVNDLFSLHHGVKMQQKCAYVSSIVPPNKDDIKCFISNLKNNLYLGAGMVEYKLQKWDQCVVTLKEVKGDNKQIKMASMIRVNAFRKMDVPFLTNNHFQNVISNETKQSIAWIETEKIDEQNKRNTTIQYKSQQSDILYEQLNKQGLDTVLSKTLSAKDIISQAFLYYRQANVIWNEEFFYSSAKKYRKASFYMNQAEVILRAPLPSILSRVRTMSFLGYVLSCLKINNYFETAEMECTNAILSLRHEYDIMLQKKYIFLFHMCRAACREKMMKFDKALDDMQQCLKICNDEKYKNEIKIRINNYRFLQTQLALGNAKKEKRNKLIAYRTL